MKLPFSFTNFKNNQTNLSQWRQCILPATCMKPKTQSFRSECENLWASEEEEEEEEVENDNLAMVVALQSERLVYDAADGGCRSSSIMEELRQQVHHHHHRVDSAVVVETLESVDPWEDFRRSMEDIVALHGGGQHDWDFMERLLSWYLHSNSKNNHHFIIAAFMDLLLDTTAPYHPSSFSSSCSSSSTHASPVHNGR